MATPRGGKPYIFVTWLAKLLGGNQCLWSAWFKAHFRYDKFEEEAADLAEWNRDHTRMVRDRVAELEEAGWEVTTENQNDFKLEGETAIVAGKPDIVAVEGVDPPRRRILIIDTKTGRERDSDFWQVLIYLFAWPLCRPDMIGRLAGERHYKAGDRRLAVRYNELTPKRRDDLVTLIRTIAGATPPRKAPSREECKRCNIGVQDCPERHGARPPVTTRVSGF